MEYYEKIQIHSPNHHYCNCVNNNSTEPSRSKPTIPIFLVIPNIKSTSHNYNCNCRLYSWSFISMVIKEKEKIIIYTLRDQYNSS